MVFTVKLPRETALLSEKVRYAQNVDVQTRNGSSENISESFDTHVIIMFIVSN